jgi:hypothetical protein
MASSPFPIADMHIFPLARAAGRLPLLRNSDHLLRRFGQLDLLELAAGQRLDLPVRGEADCFLFPVSGTVEAALMDLRPSSPSHGARAAVALNVDEPKGLLVPFGVACSLQAASQAVLIQLSTHSEAHSADRAANPAELKPLQGLID